MDAEYNFYEFLPFNVYRSFSQLRRFIKKDNKNFLSSFLWNVFCLSLSLSLLQTHMHLCKRLYSLTLFVSPLFIVEFLFFSLIPSLSTFSRSSAECFLSLNSNGVLSLTELHNRTIQMRQLIYPLLRKQKKSAVFILYSIDNNSIFYGR